MYYIRVYALNELKNNNCSLSIYTHEGVYFARFLSVLQLLRDLDA